MPAKTIHPSGFTNAQRQHIDKMIAALRDELSAEIAKSFNYLADQLAPGAIQPFPERRVPRDEADGPESTGNSPETTPEEEEAVLTPVTSADVPGATEAMLAIINACDDPGKRETLKAIALEPIPVVARLPKMRKAAAAP